MIMQSNQDQVLFPKQDQTQHEDLSILLHISLNKYIYHF